MPKTERQSFLLYHEFQELFHLLSLEERGLLITAVFEYAINGTTPADLPLGVQMAMISIRNAMDRDAAAYAIRCEKNAQNGKKGGRPRLSERKLYAQPEETHRLEPEETESIEETEGSKETEKTERLFLEPKKAERERDRERERERDRDRERERERERESAWESGVSDGFFEEPFEEPVREGEKAPCSASRGEDSVPTAPPLCEKEKNLLLSAGVEAEYFEPRAERAYWSAKRSGKERTEVLRTWWQADRGRGSGGRSFGGGSRGSPSGSEGHEKSYDLDEFWRAALARTYPPHMVEEILASEA